MGCCASSLEINVDDLRPYGFAPRLWNSYGLFVDMMARRRHARSLQEIVRRLALDRNSCSRQLAQVQLDVEVHAGNSARHEAGGQAVLHRASLDEVRRLERHARRIMTLRSLADQTIRMLTEETIGADLLATLECYTQVPFIQYSRERLTKIVQNVEKRSELTQQQSAEFKSLLDDLDQAEAEAEAEESEEASAIRRLPDAPTEELALLARISVPDTL